MSDYEKLQELIAKYKDDDKLMRFLIRFVSRLLGE